MKRIVKEITEWKVGDKVFAYNPRPDPDIEQPYCIKLTIKEIREFKIICVSDRDSIYPFNRDSLGGYDNAYDYRLIAMEQITFEEAMANWMKMPICGIKENKVLWIALSPHDDDFSVCCENGTVVDGLPGIKLEDSLHVLKNVFQAESWEDLYLNVIPNLIRMARSNK